MNMNCSNVDKVAGRLQFVFIRLVVACLVVPGLSVTACAADAAGTALEVSRSAYHEKLKGFWLGQSIANWTGLVTEMDKIGGAGEAGIFYTREDWGRADQPSIWGEGVPSELSPTISWVFENEAGAWGADDDTDIEYIYQALLNRHQTSVLTGEQIRDGWLEHIYADENTPFRDGEGKPENYLWVSNQRAHDLMRVEGMVPPQTSDPSVNSEYEMIDAQLTTEIFGLFSPARPDFALQMAHLPIRTTARDNAAWAAEFYVTMYSLASSVNPEQNPGEQINWMAKQARKQLPEGSYSAAMYDFVWAQFNADVPWESVRDELYQRYQVRGEDGYDISERNLYCNGCFASGINFAASLVSLFYGKGEYQETVKIAVLMGWDSDNPAATWGGLLGFMMGFEALENLFDREFSETFHIHRTRGGFPGDGLDTFEAMADAGLQVVDRTVIRHLGGRLDESRDTWDIPNAVVQGKD